MAAVVTVNDVLDRACEPGCGVPRSDLSERLCAEPAGGWAGGVVSDRASGLPDPVAGDHGEDRYRVPQGGGVVRRGQPDSGSAVREGRPQDRSDAAISGAAGGDRPVWGGRDRGCAGVRAGVHRDQEGRRGKTVWFSFAVSQRRVTCYYFYVWLRHEVARCEWLREGGRLMPET